MIGKALVVLVVAALCVSALEADAERPRLHRPRIVGAVPRAGTKHLQVVVVPKGDPRARGGANPFLPITPATAVPGASSAVPILRSSTPMTEVTQAQLLACMPGLGSSKATTVLPFMNSAMKEAEVNTCARTAAFLAQLGHESGSLVYMEELASGAKYEGRPDLGNTQRGDGKRFKGRGPIQLTGRANYVAAGRALGLDLVSNPPIVATNAVGFRTSAWFWKSKGLNALADIGDFGTITLRINGGTNGEADRNMRWGKCKIALACPGAHLPVDPFPQCTARGGKCQTATCNGVVVRGLCGSGAATCCTPSATTPTTPTTPVANDPNPKCTAALGKCQTTTCDGVVVRGLCSGAATCCTPKFPACAKAGGKCQTTTCNGTVQRGLCGSGAETCCVPRVLQAGVPAAARPAPAIPAAYAPCTAIKGTCQTTACTGMVVANKCGPGAARCCVPPGALPAAPVIGSLGLDISQPLTAAMAKCMVSNRYTWISIRGGRSNGKVDANAVASIRQAVAAGFKPDGISVYIFPMSDTADAASGGRQVTAMWQALAPVKDSFSTIWLDVEAAKWRTTGQNRLFFESMVAACQATGKKCGVYTSKVFWTQIMGASYTGGQHLPLWFPHYQSPAQQAMTDFVAFGGWTQPWAKQYKETTKVCGIGADLNVMNAAWKAPAPVLRSTAPAAPQTPAPQTPAPARPILRAATPAAGASITAAQLMKCMPGLAQARANEVLPHINAAQSWAAINTCKRKTAWLAQLGHESGSLKWMQELASGAAYEGRKDLGNTQRGDGKRFKGRGPIQLTGRANYAAAGKALGLNLIANPTSVATFSVGFKTSAWFWKTKGLNALADAGNFAAITKRINGGTNGAADRNKRYAACRKVLGC